MPKSGTKVNLVIGQTPGKNDNADAITRVASKSYPKLHLNLFKKMFIRPDRHTQV